MSFNKTNNTTPSGITVGSTYLAVYENSMFEDINVKIIANFGDYIVAFDDCDTLVEEGIIEAVNPADYDNPADYCEAIYKECIEQGDEDANTFEEIWVAEWVCGRCGKISTYSSLSTEEEFKLALKTS